MVVHSTLHLPYVVIANLKYWLYSFSSGTTGSDCRPLYGAVCTLSLLVLFFSPNNKCDCLLMLWSMHISSDHEAGCLGLGTASKQQTGDICWLTVSEIHFFAAGPCHQLASARSVWTGWHTIWQFCPRCVFSRCAQCISPDRHRPWQTLQRCSFRGVTI